MKRLLRGARHSLRHRLLLATVTSAIVLFAGIAALVKTSATMRSELSHATDAFIEEQYIADRLLRSVTRQLVAATTFAQFQNNASMGEFRAAGEDAYKLIYKYLQRSLTADQRLQLQLVKEELERLEVAATDAFDLFARGQTAQAHRSATAMINHGTSLQNALDGFLALRERDLIALRERQRASFRYMYGGAAALGALMLIGALLLARFVQRRINAPLAELTTAAARVGAGDLDATIATEFDDEFAAMAQSFNEMVRRLAETKSDLEDRNHQLQAALETLRTMQNELVQTEKLSAMGRMMGGLAHELNNPLASVLGFAELLGTRLDEPVELRRDEIRDDYLQPLLQEAVRARSLVRDFLHFSRQPGPGLSAVNVREAIDVIVRLRTYAFEQEGLTIELQDGPDTYVLAQPQKLQQVFLNVANNALDAMKTWGRGCLHIIVQRNGDYVNVSFDDDGPGLDLPDRVFEPFFTTKPVGEGTGLGLALVHQFVDEFGGGVRAENRRTGGARITIRLRAVESPAANEAAKDTVSPAAQIAARAARILVLEDEEPLRNLQKRFLSRLDADILLASAVEEAQEIVRATHLDLVISDVKMPGGKNGVDFYRWMQRERPELAEHFMFVTGDVTDTEIAEIAAEQPDRVLRKPFMLQEYLERVAKYLS